MKKIYILLITLLLCFEGWGQTLSSFALNQKPFNFPDNLGINYSSLKIDSKGNKWFYYEIGYEWGLYKFSNESLTKYPINLFDANTDNFTPHSPVNDIDHLQIPFIIDAYDNIWITTLEDSSFFYLFNGQNWKLFTYSKPLYDYFSKINVKQVFKINEDLSNIQLGARVYYIPLKLKPNGNVNFCWNDDKGNVFNYEFNGTTWLKRSKAIKSVSYGKDIVLGKDIHDNDIKYFVNRIDFVAGNFDNVAWFFYDYNKTFLVKVIGESATIYKVEESLRWVLKTNFSHLTIDSQNNLWYTNSDMYLVKFDGNKFTNIIKITDDITKEIPHVVLDNKNNRWFYSSKINNQRNLVKIEESGKITNINISNSLIGINATGKFKTTVIQNKTSNVWGYFWSNVPNDSKLLLYSENAVGNVNNQILDKGINIISPTENTEFFADSNEGIEVKWQPKENTLVTRVKIGLYDISTGKEADLPVYCGITACKYYPSKSLKSGTYELRVSNAANEEIKGSVKVKIKGNSFIHGVTVVTHGFQLTGGDNVDDFVLGIKDDNGNIREIGLSAAIKKRVELEGGKASIYYNDINTSKWKKVAGEGNSSDEIILFFNWSISSNDLADGALEAAADNLFAMLARPMVKGSGDIPDNLFESDLPFHFIAHSRGNIVLLQVLHRLAKYFPNKKIDHFTLLDPHPAIPMNDMNENSETKSLPGVYGLSKKYPSEPYIKLPYNVQKADVYYRQARIYEPIVDPIVLLPLLQNIANVAFITLFPNFLSVADWKSLNGYYGNFSGIFVNNASINTQLNEDLIKEGVTPLFGIKVPHSGVHEWYRGTIVPNEPYFEQNGKENWYKTFSRKQSGYYYSRVANGVQNLKTIANTISLDEMNARIIARTGDNLSPVYDSKLKYVCDVNKTATTGLKCVSYGWAIFGGNAFGEIDPFHSFGFSKDGYTINSQIKNTLKHNYFYFPANFPYLKITIGNYKVGDKLIVSFNSRDKNYITEIKTLTVDNTYYFEVPADLLGDVGTFEIAAWGINKILTIKNVELLKEKPIVLKNASINIFPNPTTNQFSIDLKDIEGKAQSLTIIDEKGTIIAQKAIDETCCENMQVDFPQTGVYSVIIQTDKGTASKKLSVNK